MEIRTRGKAGCRDSLDHGPIAENGKVEGRAVEGNELRRESRDLFHERRDQVLLGSLSDVRCPERVNDPVTALVQMGDQRPNTDDRVEDVLGEPVEASRSRAVSRLT